MRWRAAYVGLVGLLAVTWPATDDDQRHGSPIDVRRVELDAAPTGLVSVGDVLLANGRQGDTSTGDQREWWALLRSTDLGETWASLTLPGAPRGVSYVLDGPEDVGEGVAAVKGVVGVDSSGPTVSGHVAYLWASVDGRTWWGGRFAGDGLPIDRNVIVRAAGGMLFAAADTQIYRSTDLGVSWSPVSAPDLPLAPGETATVTDLWQTTRGRLVANLGNGDGRPPLLETGPAPVLVSDDSGMTWHLDVCPSEVPSNGSCLRDPPTGDPEIRTAASLQIRRTPRGEQVSTDGGAVWRDVDLHLDAARPSDVFFNVIVPRDDGGWLAVATIDPAGDYDVDLLLASDDGVQWRDLSPNSPCETAQVQEDPDVILPSASFSRPLRFDGRWLVIHTCAGENTLVQSELLLVGGSATEATPVPGTRRDAVAYGSPVAVGDDVVMLEVHEDDGDEMLLQVRPSD